MMTLKKYKAKRDFTQTKEPSGKNKKSTFPLNELKASAAQGGAEKVFVIQKHDASHLHYDFRIEVDGVLASWAVPKGPSMNPRDKRLAIHVEDHPYDYKDFEGVIPEGNYGAGTVIVWDGGTYELIEGKNVKSQISSGSLKLRLKGKKLKGEFALVKIKNPKEKNQDQWLLIKHNDKYANKKIPNKEASIKTGRTIEEVAALHTENPKEKSLNSKKIDTKKLGLSSSTIPDPPKPMLATLHNKPFSDKDWIFELKLDGYRAIAYKKGTSVKLYSRNQKSFNKKYASIYNVLKKIQYDFILDGEIVALDTKGKSSFELLQNYQNDKKTKLLFYIFDILYLDQYDLQKLPLIKRKEILKKFLPDHPLLEFVDHIKEKGEEMFAIISKKGIEGIIAKKKDSKYQAGERSKNWLKIKNTAIHEAIICGCTKSESQNKKFGSLILGAYHKKNLVYIGNVGTGFTEDSLEILDSKFKQIIRKTSPFSQEITVPGKLKNWLSPKLVCQIKFTEWTSDNKMRHPVFLGLRDDKTPKEVEINTA